MFCPTWSYKSPLKLRESSQVVQSEASSEVFSCHKGLCHKIREWQNHLGWKRTSRSSSRTVNLTWPSPPLNHVPKCHTYTSFKYLQGWWLNHFSGQLVPVPDNPFSEEISPNIQSKIPLVQLAAIFSCPVACYWEKRPTPPRYSLLSGSCGEQEGLPSASFFPD